MKTSISTQIVKQSHQITVPDPVTAYPMCMSIRVLAGIEIMFACATAEDLDHMLHLLIGSRLDKVQVVDVIPCTDLEIAEKLLAERAPKQ
jgi:hypothetical protein